MQPYYLGKSAVGHPRPLLLIHSEMAPIIGKKVAKGPAKKKAVTYTIDCRLVRAKWSSPQWADIVDMMVATAALHGD